MNNVIECKGDKDIFCETVCDHYDLEDGHCLDCGADLTEELSAMAYDRYKDQRYED